MMCSLTLVHRLDLARTHLYCSYIHADEESAHEHKKHKESDCACAQEAQRKRLRMSTTSLRKEAAHEHNEHREGTVLLRLTLELSHFSTQMQEHLEAMKSALKTSLTSQG